MFDRLGELEQKYLSISDKINDPAVIANQNEWRELMKEHSTLTPIIEAYRAYKNANTAMEEARAMMEESLDDEMKQLVKEEYNESKERIEQIKEALKILLLPKDPNDEKNVIVEIRGGAGGDEAALFASNLYRMYFRYAERHRWKTELMSVNENDIGGFKEVTFLISGKAAFSRLKYESGVHRVQRIPTTESRDRKSVV